MWETLRSAPRGRVYTRNFVMFFATLLVASFAYIFTTAPTAYAVDATWDGESISYENKTFTGPVDTAGKRGLTGIPAGAQMYQATQQSGGITTAYVIYFEAGDAPKSSKEATYITYTLNPPNTYSNASSKTPVTLTAPTGEQPDTEEGFSECTIDAIGWIACPVMKTIASGMDTVYDMIDGYLVVQPLSTADDSPLYRVWAAMRDFANVAFIIAFLLIVYSQLTSVGISNYSIKKMLPRIIIAAVLVNISYVVCAVAVDISNILGSSVNELFGQIREGVLPGSQKEEITWEGVTSFILSGGSAAAAGVIGVSLAIFAVGGAVTGLWFIIAPFLLGAFLIIIVTFLILAARQAIIVILIVIAPLAFVAYLLPNTEKWYERWQKTFFTMLVMFPAFAAVFGGAQLAASLIIRTATSLEQVILGLGVQVAPLAITPLLLKLGGGLLNRFAGIINNPQKGFLDRYKNYNKDRLAEHRAKAEATNADRFKAGTLSKRRNPMRYAAQKNYMKKAHREGMKAKYEDRAKRQFEDGSGIETSIMGKRKRTKYDYNDIDHLGRDTDLIHQTTEARHEKHWKQRLNPENDNPADRELLKRQMTMQNYQEGSKEAQAVYDAAYASAKTFKPYKDGESAATAEQRARLRAMGLTEDLDTEMKVTAATSQSIAVEGLKLKAAEVVAQGQLAELYKGNVKIREGDLQGALDRAGGIDQHGKTKVEARATADLTALHMENVKAVNSIFSNDRYDVPELFDVIQKGVLRGGAPADDMHVHAAIQQVMLDKGNNWSAQKLQDYIGTQAIRPDDSEEDKTRKTDLQQIFADAVKNSKLKVGYLSGTDRGKLQTGTFNISSRDAIIRDIEDEKIKPERIASEDIDVLSRMVQVLRDPASQKNMTEKNRTELLASIHEAQTNDNLKGLSGPREKNMMTVIANYLKDPTYQQSEDTKEAPASKRPDHSYTISDPYESGSMAPEDDE